MTGLGFQSFTSSASGKLVSDEFSVFLSSVRGLGSSPLLYLPVFPPAVPCVTETCTFPVSAVLLVLGFKGDVDLRRIEEECDCLYRRVC